MVAHRPLQRQPRREGRLEIVTFRLGAFTCAVRADEVRDVLPRGPVSLLPEPHHAVPGVFRRHGCIVPLVSLRHELQVRPGDAHSDQTLLVTEHSGQPLAYAVDRLEGRQRLRWEQIVAVPTLSPLSPALVAAVARIDSRLVYLLDMDSIAARIIGDLQQMQPVERPLPLDRSRCRIVVADASATMQQALGKALRSGGFANVTTFAGSQALWTCLERSSGLPTLLILSASLPKTGGLELLRRLREHPSLGELPVLLYSPVVTPEIERQARLAGAAYVSQPELGRVADLADDLIRRQRLTHLASRQTPEVVQPGKASLLHWITPAITVRPADMVRGELEPAWEIDDDEEPPIDPRRWQSFRRELDDRLRTLQPRLETLTQGSIESSLCQDLLVALRWIELASRIVPAPVVVRLTILLESRLIAAQAGDASWPSTALEAYFGWLLELADASADVSAVLARGRVLCGELA